MTGEYHNPHLLTRPDRADPAIDFVGLRSGLLEAFC